MRNLFTVIVLFSFLSCQQKTEQAEQSQITRDSVLIEKAKQETLARLKSPSTAVFIDSLATIMKMKDAEAYRVGISVDAQNSFGATTRERYFAVLQDKGGDSLSIDNYELTLFID